MLASMLGALAAVVVIAGVWVFFGPAPLGGAVTPLVVRGDSMEPAISSGDFVIARRESHYHPGDVIAFRDDRLRVNVIHRIVSRTGDRYLTRGDNRNGTDSIEPTHDQIIGRVWFHGPGLAGAAEAVASPLGLTLLLLGGAAIGFAATGATLTGARRRPRQGRNAGVEGLSAQSPVGMQIGLLSVIAIVGGIAIVTMTAWRGTTIDTFSLHGYQIESALSYGGAVATHGIYDDDTLIPPSPLYRAARSPLAISYTTQIIDNELGLDGVAGEHHIWAVVSDGDNWSRTIELAASSAFSGATATTAAPLALRDIDAAIADIRAIVPNEGASYRVTIHASTVLSAQIGGQPVTESSEETLQFALNERGLIFVGNLEQQAESSIEGAVPQPLEVNRTVAVPIAGDITVSELAPRGWWAIGPGLVVLLIVGLATVLTARTPGAADRARLGRLLSRTTQGPALPGRMIEVASLIELAGIAEQRSQVVLEVEDLGAPAYVVIDNQVGYRFRPAKG